MENTDYERPNTVSGLNAKRKELVKLLGNITAEAERVRTSIKHIDACVALFDPNAKPLTTYHDGFIPRHTAPKGHLKRFILTQLREASEPLSARQIAEAWAIDQMIETDTETLRLLRKRIGISINTIKHDGLVVSVGMDGPSKLWAVKKGDH
ncbi:hypothetical protein FHS72_003724 [Loktanella ponticola]|uniref:Uncharacterized protein n=1 Tax=Yoonia ponticola TaxID=1524255 RepID=A0A7W9EZU3_9RHOB|nr:hypothetical protein [Yoonia ponticola]MBB5724074.1 hypothetical protein [Yoonia ponticola]